MDFVRELKAEGKDVFLDLKMFDIPETVKRAVAQVARVGVQFLTVHSSSAVMRAAMEGKQGSGLELLAVTVLTSFDRQDLDDYGYSRDVSDLVQFLARKAMDAKVEGIVTSPLEVANVRRIVGPKMTLVIPGVRSAGAARGDQKRVATPADALRDGADYLVIGRQITRAPEPVAEVARILDEIAAVPSLRA
jgi:orotidine-5'-phosphate decarboxylase